MTDKTPRQNHLEVMLAGRRCRVDGALVAPLEVSVLEETAPS